VKRAHHELVVWQSGIALVKTIYSLTSTFPREEVFGLTAQMRRAAVSVPSNIAEGAARSPKKEFAHFLVIARSSLSELETQLEIAKQLGYLAEDRETEQHVDKIFALLGGLIRSNQAKLNSPA
jgi:four helix bundle protein